jgi:hypothetical protein
MNVLSRSACFAAGMVFLLPARIAQAQSKQECAAAYERAQVSRLDLELARAREELAVCATDPCPARMRRQCATWAREVEQEMPSVVVSVRAPKGGAVAGARLLVDGEPSALDAVIALDPGKHVLRVEAPGVRSQEREVSLALRERRREIEFVLEGKPRKARTPPPAARSEALPASVWVLGAVGITGLGVGTYVGLGALSRRSDLDACKPSCPREDVDRVERDYVISEIAVGVGVVALGAAAVIAFGSSRESPALGLTIDSRGGRAALHTRF